MSRAWFVGLLCKLPSFNPAWAGGVRAGWWGCFRAMYAEAASAEAAGMTGTGRMGTGEPTA